LSRFQSPFLKLAHAVLACAAVVFLCTAFQRVAPVRVIPNKACPGQTVLLRAESAGFTNTRNIRVAIGDRIAPVVRIVDSVTVEVMIPELDPGEVPIQIQYMRTTLGSATVEITAPPLRRIFLRMENDTVTVERVRPFTGEYDNAATSGRRLSYDVTSARGRLLYTGAIPHPATATFEVFGSAGRSSPIRVPAPEPYHFMIKIPYSSNTILVKLYEVPDSLDLATERGRAARTLIKEIEVTGQP